MDESGIVSGILIFVVLLVAGVALLQFTGKGWCRDHQVKLFAYAFGIRFLVSVLVYEFGLVNIIKDEDASGWIVGMWWHNTWTQQGVSIFEAPFKFIESYGQHHQGYYYLVAIFFHMTGMPARLVAAALNCFFGAWTAIVCFRTAKELFTDEIATSVGWWACWYPSLVMWSAQTVKEPVVILLESLVIYGCVSIRHKGAVVGNLLMIATAIVLLIPFRFYAAYIAAATVALSFVMGSMATKRVSSSNSIAYFVLMSIAFMAMAMFLLGREKETEMFQAFDLEGIERYRNNMANASGAGAGSNVKIESDLTSTSGFGVSLAIGATYLLFAPFPWQLVTGSTRMLIVAPEVMLWWWLLIAGVVPGIAFTVRTRFRDVAPLLFMVVGLALLYSLTFANIGLVYRQRAQLLPWLIIFAAVGRSREALDEDPPTLHAEPA